ncbi:atrial natriuretic peptide receptor 2-like [Lineus longissimus]|uniref:atrial natriuretic peptide receptor 2-like n=1 Tax=Lineus longissimus TaxID=88925 RepID=UPI00315C8366
MSLFMPTVSNIRKTTEKVQARAEEIKEKTIEQLDCDRAEQILRSPDNRKNFGLESLRDNTGLTKQKRKDARNRIYRPRECGPDVFFSGSMQTVDVYAYGVILIELVNRKPPYLEFDPERLEPNWKPPIPMFHQDQTDDDDVCLCEEEYTELMLYCLSDIPKYRPSIKKTKRYMKRLQMGDNKDVSRKLGLLEAYSSLLESHVKEEKEKLETEKRKLVDLYHVLVPKTLSTESGAAKGGCFKDCTVYFSDIVGFTSLVAESSPKEVVSLLNKVYTSFLRVVDKYEVCVVEVIGDGYLMVSGAPCPNPQRAKVVANMSLDLLKHYDYFPILHQQREKLVIRIGLNSGSVYGGIIHQAIPTFHIFGEAVTMASRIAATSKARKIHISETTFKLLEECGEYVLKRNTLSVKGTRTWWLLGKLEHPTTSEAESEPQQVGGSVRSSSVTECGDCSTTHCSETSETLSEKSAQDVAITLTMEGHGSPV